MKIVDEIIETLRQDIVTRRLADGERLPSEKELSDRFGVSQPTVREAIRALDTLGLVEVLHGNGSFVRSDGDYALASALQTLLQLESVGILQVLDVRQVLGRHSIGVAARQATEQDIQAIAASVARFDHLNGVEDVGEVIACIIDFQRAVSSASHNPVLHSLESFLLALLNEVQVRSLAQRGVRFWLARALDFQPYRVAVLDGLRSGDPDQAEAAMNRYFDAQRALFYREEVLRSLNLANPTVVTMVSAMVRQSKG